MWLALWATAGPVLCVLVQLVAYAEERRGLVGAHEVPGFKQSRRQSAALVVLVVEVLMVVVLAGVAAWLWCCWPWR